MASILKVDTITGVSTAGSIAVTGEGNSTTTNLQQGLAKSWCNLNFSTAAIADSFNTASITDSATGRFVATFTSAMNNALYSSSGSSRFNLAASDISGRAVNHQPAAGSVKINSFTTTDGSLTDDQGVDSQFCGDLA
jgi:hypothetical protein